MESSVSRLILGLRYWLSCDVDSSAKPVSEYSSVCTWIVEDFLSVALLESHYVLFLQFSEKSGFGDFPVSVSLIFDV
jgi:hypothetical protein